MSANLISTPPPILPPSHNLFGDHGPRCPVCSGLGRYLSLGSDGRPTRSTSRCICNGTGIDQEIVRDQRVESIIQRLNRLELEYAEGLLRNAPKLSRQSWVELIAYATQDATAVANTTTEAIIVPNVTMPANYMQDSRALRLIAYGKLSTTGTPTMTWALRWGGVTGTLLATSEAITMGSGVTNVNWTIELDIQTRANGATGTLLAMGKLHVHTAAGTVLSNIIGVSGFDAPSGVTSDLTADTALALTGDWSAASASNTLTGMIYNMASLN